MEAQKVRIFNLRIRPGIFMLETYTADYEKMKLRKNKKKTDKI